MLNPRWLATRFVGVNDNADGVLARLLRSWLLPLLVSLRHL
jgi:hypothetical protein